MSATLIHASFLLLHRYFRVQRFTILTITRCNNPILQNVSISITLSELKLIDWLSENMLCFPKLCFVERFCRGVETRRTAQEPMATEVRDLESQIVEQQAVAPRSSWERLFGCFYPRVRSRPTSDNQRSDHSRNHIEISQNSNSAIANIDGKATSHISLSLASDQSESLILDETESTTITEMDGNVASIETRSIASTASVWTDVTGHSNQRIIIPPPKVHTTNSLSTIEFQEFVPEKSPALASCRTCTHVNFGRDEDRRQIGRGEHLGLSDIFQGPPPPKSLSAKERLRVRYAPHYAHPVVESASVAVLNTHGFDQDVEPPYLPARQSWVGYHKYIWYFWKTESPGGQGMGFSRSQKL